MKIKFKKFKKVKSVLKDVPKSHNDDKQVVVYSTLLQEYSTLTVRGEVVVAGGGVEERSKVIYWHRGDMVIYYK